LSVTANATISAVARHEMDASAALGA